MRMRKTLIRDFPDKIDSVMPADLNGDNVQDVLLYSYETKTITIHWGTGDYATDKSLYANVTRFTEAYVEPLLLDYNGNRYVDILTSFNDSSHRHIIECQRNKTKYGKVMEETHCTTKELRTLSDLPTVVRPHSNSFVDVDGDLNADILISTLDHFEVWIWQKDDVYKKARRPYPLGLKSDKLGQSVFVDIDSSGRLLHVVQVCSPSCNQAYIWLPNSTKDWTSHGKWEKIIDLKDQSFWKDNDYADKVNAMMSLKSADFDQDGYPDFAAIVNLSNNSGRGLISFTNKKCDGKGDLCVINRSFKTDMYPGDFSQVKQVTNLGFFDIRENGKMDVLVTQGDIKFGNWSIKALENAYSKDACFIKVIIVSGLCSKDHCDGKGDTIEYGYNQPGPLAMYTITDSEAKMRSSAAAQLYQTSHGSLQLPYILFGIGQSPNFVESLEIRMPGLNKSHQWTQIIPNSQMLVIPNPIKEPSLWQNKLFITPSRKMLHTGLALCGVVLVNLIIVLVLHLMEKKADRIEKQQQAHKFNFEAM
ncbi:T-cell immunomodulatory protein-like isoform X2 [Varroa destructor]|uniref:T-cell immunomodulatory protein TIP C2 domain-containing protein n=1 Tax=Varroa destructor TaxID=109461 RepID=A0A7M7MDU1_VARDE|nr:T-cell immunomodulatory protein-like isoform X2 [Varroa destructor]